MKFCFLFLGFFFFSVFSMKLWFGVSCLFCRNLWLFSFSQERVEYIIYNGESLKCSRKSSLQRGLEREGVIRHSRCACVEKGHAFGEIYSTWLHCKGFSAWGCFCSLPLPSALSTLYMQELKGVSAWWTHGHRMLWSGKEDWVLTPAKPQGQWKCLSSLQPGALTGARISLMGRKKNKAQCCAEMHLLAMLLSSSTFGRLSLPLPVSQSIKWR